VACARARSPRPLCYGASFDASVRSVPHDSERCESPGGGLAACGLLARYERSSPPADRLCRNNSGMHDREEFPVVALSSVVARGGLVRQ
jgi:hypothetical protein